MGANFSVSVDLSEVFAANQAIADAALPLVGQAVRFVAAHGAATWKSEVWKARLWSGDKVRYADSIGWRETGQWAAEIAADDSRAQEIEDGLPQRDLKRMLGTSKKVRVAQEGGKHAGQRYLIIPFQHNMPTSSGEGAHAPQMPDDVYAEAKELRTSLISGSTLRVSGQASAGNAARWGALAAGRAARGAGAGSSTFLVHQNVYSWGARLQTSNKRYSGMVRFDTSAGGATSSKYLTFRVMGEWSSGWVVQAKPGLRLAEKVAGQLQPLLNDAMAEAVTLKSLRR